MASCIAADGSGRSTSVIPAIPAAWSVTIIAFIPHLPVSNARLGETTEDARLGAEPLLQGGHVGARLLAVRCGEAQLVECRLDRRQVAAAGVGRPADGVHGS